MNKAILKKVSALLLLVGTAAHANVDNPGRIANMNPSRRLVSIDDATFNQLNAGQVEMGTDYYNQSVMSFTEWKQNLPVDSEALNLFPSFKERMTVDKKGNAVPEGLVIFEARTKLLVTKDASKIDIAAMIKPEFIAKMDPNISNTVITSAQALPKVSRQGATLNNFEWCNERAKGKYIGAPMRGTDLSDLQDPARDWCSADSRSICLESCFIYTPGVVFALKEVVNWIANPEKDLGQATQSEIRYFLDEKELNMKSSLASLTHINTPVRGGLVQSMFYSNQLAKFTKVIAVLQDGDASKPGTSILTIILVAAIKRHTWEENYKAITGEQLILGQAYLGPAKINTRACIITDGLPRFTQCTASRIADVLGQ